MGSFLFLVLQQSGNDRYPRWNSELSICGGPGQGLPPPLLGQHTEEVLTSVLGWDAAKLAELKTQKII